MSEQGPGLDRRKNRRFEVAVRVHVAQLGEVSGALTRDLSASGLLIETQVAYAAGSALPVRIVDPRTGNEIHALCKVVRQVKNEAGRVQALGLEFTHVDEALAARLNAFVQDVAEPAAAAAPAGTRAEATEVTVEDPGLALDAVAIPNIMASRAGLQPMLVHIMSFVDGRRTHDEIAQLVGHSPVQTLAAMRELRDLDLVELVAPTPELTSSLEPAPVELSQDELRTREAYTQQKARDHLTEAVRAERAGRVAEAVSLMEQALALRPANDLDIHVRLARLAIGRLADFEMAALHIERIRSKYPSAEELGPLTQELAARQAEISQAREAARKTVVEAAAPVRIRVRQRLVLIAGILLWVGLIGFNVWRWVIPHDSPPKELKASVVAAWVPARRVQLHQGRLLVTVADGWGDLKKADRVARLEKLAAWSRKRLNVAEVVLAAPGPVLVGRARDTKIVVY